MLICDGHDGFARVVNLSIVDRAPTHVSVKFYIGFTENRALLVVDQRKASNHPLQSLKFECSSIFSSTGLKNRWGGGAIIASDFFR